MPGSDVRTALNLRRSANLERQVLHGPIAWSTNTLDDAPKYYERVCLRAAAELCGLGEATAAPATSGHALRTVTRVFCLAV